MKVHELIAILQKHDPELPVLLEHFEEGTGGPAYEACHAALKSYEDWRKNDLIHPGPADSAEVELTVRFANGRVFSTREPPPPLLEIDIDGYVDEKGIKYIGKAVKQPDGKWVCLANVAGTLCRVEVAITPKEIRT